jgi:universal stress protein A
MALPKKILVPLDFSPTSLAAVETALELAARFDASLELVHVWEPPPIYGPDALVAGGMSLYMELEEHRRRAAKKEMENLVARLEQRGLRGIRTHVERGPPAPVILDVATKGGFDLVVMGTHGRTGVSRFFMGSVAEKVVRLSPIPVLTVRHRDVPAEISPT